MALLLAVVAYVVATVGMFVEGYADTGLTLIAFGAFAVLAVTRHGRR